MNLNSTARKIRETVFRKLDSISRDRLMEFLLGGCDCPRQESPFSERHAVDCPNHPDNYAFVEQWKAALGDLGIEPDSFGSIVRLSRIPG
jgi:hypothetical protein